MIRFPLGAEPDPDRPVVVPPKAALKHRRGDKVGVGDVVMLAHKITEVKRTADGIVLTYEDGLVHRVAEGDSLPLL